MEIFQHPSIAAEFKGFRSLHGRGTAEYDRTAQALQTMASHPARFIEFVVLDDTAAPAFRSGDVAMLDMKRSAFIDGAHYVFDFDHMVQPRPCPLGMPLRFYPSIYKVGRTMTGLQMWRGAGKRESIAMDRAMRACVGRVVCGFRLYGNVE